MNNRGNQNGGFDPNQGFFNSDINDFSNFPTQEDFTQPNANQRGFNQQGSQNFNPQGQQGQQGFNQQNFNPQGQQGFNQQNFNQQAPNSRHPNRKPKPQKQPKQPKQPRQPRQQGQPMQMNQPNNPNNSFGGGKKKKSPLIILIPIVLILIVVFIVVGATMLRGNTDTPPNSGEVEVQTPPVEDNPPVEEPPVETPPIEDVPPIDNPSDVGNEGNEIVDTPDVPEYSYENSMIGIKFNYDPNLYIKENVEDIFNIINQSIPEGEATFNLYTHKLPTNLNIAKLTTGNSDGLYISISILPFEIEKETTTLKIDGTTEVTNESIEADDLTDEELIEKYDLQIRETLEQSGCEIITYDKSSVQPVGTEMIDGTSKLKGIFTSRVYSGPVDVTTSTGVVDVLQCTIPVGKNAILITVVTDGREIEINKSMIFNEIVESLVVTSVKPEPEVDENIDVSEGETASAEAEEGNE